MPQIRFTKNIQRHVPCPSGDIEASNVREALERYFQSNPQAKGYVIDDQDELRKHMAIFINGIQIKDRSGLSDPVAPDDTIDVMQALSGG